MNKRFLTLQVIIIIAFVLLYIVAFNPEIISMSVMLAEGFKWVTSVQGIPLIPENTKSNMLYLMPTLITFTLILCWVEERFPRPDSSD